MVTLLILEVCLFVIAFLFGKRFGLLLLALGAGFVISQYEAATIVAVSAPYLKQYISYVPPLIILLPALLLIVAVKGRHRSLIPRIINSAIFSAAALVFVIASPLTPVSLSGNVPFITQNVGLLVSGLLILAILEIIFGKASKKKLEEPKK
jgi:hypothetical protein